MGRGGQVYLTGTLYCNKPLQVSPSEPVPTTLALGMASCLGEMVLDFILRPNLKLYIPGWSLSSDLEFWLLPCPQAEAVSSNFFSIKCYEDVISLLGRR